MPSKSKKVTIAAKKQSPIKNPSSSVKKDNFNGKTNDKVVYKTREESIHIASAHRKEWEELTPPGLSQMPNQSSVDVFDPSQSRPFIITIKNVSDSAIENVSLFNFEHEKQRDIIYSTNIIGYNKLLRYIQSYSSRENIIGAIHVSSASNLQPYQLLRFKDEEINGTCTVIPVHPRLDPCQNLNNVTILRYKFPIWVGLDITIEKMLPNTSVTYSFYMMTKPDSISKKLESLQGEVAELKLIVESLKTQLNPKKNGNSVK